MVRVTIQQAFDLASQHHQAGRLADAEALYRQILAQQPQHVDAIHNLGVLAHQLGRNDMAVELIRRVLALDPNLPEAHSNLGNAFKDLGQLEPAIAAYRRAIALKPDYAEAHNNLGRALQIKGALEQAIAADRRAIALMPNFPEAHTNLGNALKESRRLDEAIAAYRRAIDINPNGAQAHTFLAIALYDNRQLDQAIAAYRRVIELQPNLASAHNNLGVALKDTGQFDEAITAYRVAIALKPDFPEAHGNLGNALLEKGQLDEAIAAYHRAIALRPNYAEAHSNLGRALREKGELDEALAACRAAIAIRPNYAEAHNILGIVLQGKGLIDEAITAFREAISLKANDASAHGNLANALKDKGQLDLAIAAYHQAMALKPNDADAYGNLGNAFKQSGQLDLAIAAYRRAIAIKPSFAEAHSNLLLLLFYHPAYGPREIAEEQQRWNLQHAEPLRRAQGGLLRQFVGPPSMDSGRAASTGSGRAHANDPSSERRLRIGYVSPDFREHVVAQNILPLFLHHDRNQFDITCYAQVPQPDATTRWFGQHADRWRSIVGISDGQVAQQIRDDQIDILVDLALHSANNRLRIFARKPAPVQVTFAGYPGSTGLSAIDYRLSDPYLDPPAPEAPGDESVYSEKTIRLPDSFWCYDSLEKMDVSVNGLPALESGIITFGCLNNFCKINDVVLALWARVLKQVHGSRLLLLTQEGSHRQRTVERLSQEGIDPARIEFASRRARREYLLLYHRIDIGLDSFPYNGHTTSLDSLWMGVPVITLVGQTPVSRAGWSQLSNLGLSEFAGETPDQFVQIAADLAQDLNKLQSLRASLRQRMEQSPLMDAPKFARNIEAAYREMWRRYCSAADASDPLPD